MYLLRYLLYYGAANADELHLVSCLRVAVTYGDILDSDAVFRIFVCSMKQVYTIHTI